MRRDASTVAAVAFFACSVCLAAVGLVDLAGKGSRAVALAWMPMRQQQLLVAPPGGPRMVMMGRGARIPAGMLLHDAALDPLYSEGDEVIVPYKWVGKNAAGYDPEAQNFWKDEPMTKEAITAAENELLGRGTAEKSMSKHKPYVAPENVWAYLPEEEEKSMSKRQPYTGPVNVWADMPLDY